MAGDSAYNEGLIGKTGAGVPSYNEGLIGIDTAGLPSHVGGNGLNVGSDPYHYDKLIGKQNPRYDDPYHYGLIGDEGPIGKDAYNRGKVGGGGLPGPGSKPAALHTEYAQGSSSSSKAYGTQDVVFYLQRAGGGGGDGPEEGGQPNIEDGQFEGLGTENIDYDTTPPLTGGDVPQPGSPDNPYSGGQMVGGQIGAAYAAPPIFGNQGALLGTLTGHFETKDLEVGLGETTQNGGSLDNRERLLLNAINSVPNLERDLVLSGTASSEKDVCWYV